MNWIRVQLHPSSIFASPGRTADRFLEGLKDPPHIFQDMHCLFEAGRVLLFTVEPRTNCKKCVKSYVCLSVEPLTNFNSRVFGNIFLLTVDPANCRVQIMAENANPQKHLSVAEMNHGKSYMKNSSYGRVKLHIFFEFSLGTALHLAWPTTAAPLCR